MPMADPAAPRQLIVGLLRKERDHIARTIDANQAAWMDRPEYSWFSRADWLREERLCLAVCNAELARLLGFEFSMQSQLQDAADPV
jgi:hypothetical protein